MELSRKQQRILLALFCVALTYSFALTVWDVLLSSLPGINFNPTSSIPRGLYRWTHEPIHHGIVISFPQPRHPGVAQFRLPFNAKYLLKYIAAMPGDTVKVTAAGVWINGRRWPNSQAVGSPQRIAPPRLPRSRTCTFPASGSSVYGFATRR